MTKHFNFYHITKNVESTQNLLKDFSNGLKPIGRDTADAKQSQCGGLYFWANKENANRHIQFLTGAIDGGRENEVSNKVGEIEFSIPEDKLSFPDFRFDIERNEVRAKFVESFMFNHLDFLNEKKSLHQLSQEIQLNDEEKLLGIVKDTRKYAENKANSKEGDCLCLKIINNGNEEIRRPEVNDVENISVWLAKNNDNFKETYSKFLRFALSNKEQSQKLGLAFKYCGEKNIPISRISVHEIKNGCDESTIVYDQNILMKQKDIIKQNNKK